MRLFKSKKTKINQENKFLIELNQAVNYNKDKGKFKNNFHAIINKADEISKNKNRVKNKSVNQDNKIIIFFKKIKDKIIDNWELACEVGREIKFWEIAKYGFFKKLYHALSRKKSEIKIRNTFSNTKRFFVAKYGYYNGTMMFNALSTNINNSVRLNKRVLKLNR
jgi:hypothetical protein